MATTTTLERLRNAVDDLRRVLDDLRRVLDDIDYELDELEDDDDEASLDAKVCECRHPGKWHKSLTHTTYCLSPDCPCRKFEPAGGDA